MSKIKIMREKSLPMFALVQNGVELSGWEPAVPGVAWCDGEREREASSRSCSLVRANCSV